MADVRGFPGIRYHLARVGDLGSVVAPPYDVIAEADIEGLRSRSPYNVVRLTRPGTNYTSAARTFEDWRKEGVLSPDPTSIYVHEVVFDGRRRRDLIAAVRLQPYSDRVVLPHELTHRGPKEDRLGLMRATGLSLEPLWFVHERNEEVRNYVSIVAARAPAATFHGEDSTEHRLWTVTDPAVHAAIHASFNGVELLIADGHHRYETALAYADETGGAKDSASRFTLALLTELDDPGLQVLATHRVMKAGVAVTGGEEVGSLEETLAAVRGRVAAGAYRDHRFQVLPLEGEMAVVELHRQVIDNIAGKRSLEELLAYTRDPAEAVRWVDEGAGTAAFFLDAPDLGQVLKLAREGKTLPQKSTYFHPKPPSGMVFLRLDKDRPL
jgi:uncharacterized protein (DUF1015 family)